jgi:outer membrane lipoprotein-sorting protein
MSVWTRRPALRWLVPGVAAAVVLGGGAAASAIGASEDPDLPPRTAAELLVDLHTAQIGAVSGTVVVTADLGLPALPDSDQHGGADLGSLWSGSNTLRVWYDGPERARVALIDTLSQSDIIRNGQDLWVWESSENKASHWTLPEGFATDSGAAALHPPLSPQEAADDALAALDPSTEVSTDETTRVAGRDAYELVLSPRDDDSLISQIRLAIDAEHSLPLAVQVYGDTGRAGSGGGTAEPAFEVEFTQISFETPDPAQFEFNPPPGGTVTEQESLFAPMLPEGVDLPQVAVVGEGWTSVLVLRLPAGNEQIDSMLGFLEMLPSVSGAWGSGHAISTELFSVLVTDDGRVLVGAVTPERLAEAAGDPAAALEQ